jgi:Family of unknown function (DUF6492)
MPELAVITPTYRPDAGLFTELHRSVLEFTPEDTVHHVFVAGRDRQLFARFEGPRCRVWTHTDLLPARYVHVPRSNVYLNARRPWPPVRGWIVQQAVKIAATARMDADVVLLADSDVVLVRPVRADRFFADGRLCLHREERGVTAEMRRHVIWHRVARELLGLPPAPPPPLPDYISPLNVWDPAVVRAMQQRITEVTGRSWLDVFTGQIHISEFILYGVFVDDVRGTSADPPPSDITILHDNWSGTPLDHDAAIAFADRLGPDAIAMMISAKSHTPDEIRQAAIRRCADIVRSDKRT